MNQRIHKQKFVTIAQASDFHICSNGAKAYEVSDTVNGLKNFIRHIKKLPFSIDLLCITGDLSDDGSISSYEIVKEHFKELKIPYYFIPGNHDSKKNMASVFTELTYLNSYEDGRIFYSFIFNNKKIVLLDSVEEGEDSGSLTIGELELLEKELATKHDTIVFVHHPPLPTGIGFMDKQLYNNRKMFLDILDKAGNILLLGCGHIHRVMFSRKGNVNFAISPSTAMQLDLNLNNTAPGDFVFETAGYLIHRISLEDSILPEITTHAVQITDREEMEVIYPFND